MNQNRQDDGSRGRDHGRVRVHGHDHGRGLDRVHGVQREWYHSAQFVDYL